jgi:hypothetical protein
MRKSLFKKIIMILNCLSLVLGTFVTIAHA